MVREAGVSDKSLHFMAYLVLVFLMWCAINPDKKVNWRKASVWWVLLISLCYGVIDELLQGVVAGRSCDIMDFFADLCGVLTCLILLTFFTFWPAFLAVTGIVIFALTNLARVGLSDFLPSAANVAFFLFAFAFFTMLWIQNIHLFLPTKAPKFKWLLSASILPVGFLVAVKLFSVISERDFRWQDVIVAAAGILTAVITVYLIELFRCRRAQTSADR
jgi:hypothetical protein